MVNASDGGSDLSGGAIAGIAIGAFVGLALIALLAYLLSRWKPFSHSAQETSDAPAFPAEPPLTASAPTAPETAYAPQDATYAWPAEQAAMPAYYTTDTLAPYMEHDGLNDNAVYMAPVEGYDHAMQKQDTSMATATEAEATNANEAEPVDFYVYPSDSAQREDAESLPASPGSMEKYDPYAESLPSRRTYRTRSGRQQRSRPPPSEAAAVPAWEPPNDWDDNASELPYMRTAR